MKVIDLLNKIANGEEVPKRINYGGIVNDYDYLLNNIKRFSLNDEVEIIEDTPKVTVEMTEKEYWKYLDRRIDERLSVPKEDKKIEHINKVYDLTDFRKDYPVVAEMLKDLSNKQYEIIDKVNGE